MEQATEKWALQGKRIVFVGGSAGIGLATAKAVAAKNAQVIIASSNTERIANALKELPEGSTGYIVDATNEESVKNLFERIGRFDHLVFTAGESIVLSNISDIDTKNAQSYFNLRYWGAFMAVKYAAHYINAMGSITLTGGIASNRPNKGWSLGASICAAMEGFTRAMAMELAPVRVNIVSPGVVKTDLWASIPAVDREAMYTQIGSTLPVKRVGTAADIAKTYVYLMEQEFGTGQTIIVDGGASLV